MPGLRRVFHADRLGELPWLISTTPADSSLLISRRQIMAEQLLLFPGTSTDVEAAIQKILSLRRKCCCSGQAGEDIDLIRAALMQEAT